MAQINHCAKKTLKTSLIVFFVMTCILSIGDILEIPYIGILKVSILYLVCFRVASDIRLPSQKKISSENKAVFITGCDTGFGNSLALRLYKKGFHVFAACLDPKCEGALQLTKDSSSEIQIIKLDVTCAADVSAAQSYVEESLKGLNLWAIVNNAGIAKGTATELTSVEDFREVLDVNLLGIIRVCKAFLPTLRRSHGRVVNVTSVAGRLPWINFVPYSLSKHAANAFSDILRLEMHKWDVDVITIEPWPYRTRLFNPSSISKYLENEWSSSPDELKSAYDSNYIQHTQCTTKRLSQFLANSNIDEAIDAMEAAIMDENPLYLYNPGKWYLKLVYVVIAILPQPIQDTILCHLIFRNY